MLSSLDCYSPLGMEDGRITDNQLSASTELSLYKRSRDANLARLNGRRCWIPQKNNANQWIQINFTEETVITGIVTQGRPDDDRWVTKYLVKFSLDGHSWLNANSSDTETPRVCQIYFKASLFVCLFVFILSPVFPGSSISRASKQGWIKFISSSGARFQNKTPPQVPTTSML